MTDEEIDELTDRWIASQEAWFAGDRRDNEERRALDQMLFPGDCEPEVLWRFVQNAYKRDLPDKVFGILAAGPLEDLLANYGPDFIERVETEARQNPEFRYLLGGVWQNLMSDEIWERVQKSQGTIW